MTHSLLLCCIKVLSLIILLSHIINNTFIHSYSLWDIYIRVPAKYIHQGSVWIICWTRVDVMENCVSQPGCHDLRLSDPDMGDWKLYQMTTSSLLRGQWCWCVQREVWVGYVCGVWWMKSVMLLVCSKRSVGYVGCVWWMNEVCVIDVIYSMNLGRTHVNVMWKK